MRNLQKACERQKTLYSERRFVHASKRGKDTLPDATHIEHFYVPGRGLVHITEAVGPIALVSDQKNHELTIVRRQLIPIAQFANPKAIRWVKDKLQQNISRRSLPRHTRVASWYQKQARLVRSDTLPDVVEGLIALLQTVPASGFRWQHKQDLELAMRLVTEVLGKTRIPKHIKRLYEEHNRIS